MNIQKFSRNNYGYDSFSTSRYYSPQYEHYSYDTGGFSTLENNEPFTIDFELDNNSEILRVNTNTKTVSLNNNMIISGHDYTLNQYFSSVDAMRYTIAALRDENRNLNEAVNELRDRTAVLEIQNNSFNEQISALQAEIGELRELNGR